MYSKEVDFWKKAYLKALEKLGNSDTAKATADQYIKDYKEREKAPEFRQYHDAWIKAYFAVINVFNIIPADVADRYVKDLVEKIEAVKATLPAKPKFYDKDDDEDENPEGDED